MEITHHINKDSKTIFVKAVGEISVDDLIEYEKKLMKDSDFESGLNTLADFTYVVPSASINYNAVSHSRDFVKSIQDKRGKCKWAFIAPHDPAYGICRLFSMLSAGLKIDTVVFKTEDEAKKWLNIK
ncbi:MAG: hypothetical protein V3V59_02150 [Thermodesulfovibrionales bacterium]